MKALIVASVLLAPVVAQASPQDEVDRYHFLVKNNATLAQLCVQAMTVRVSYQLAKDSAGYQKWDRMVTSPNRVLNPSVCENTFYQQSPLSDLRRDPRAAQLVKLASDGIVR